MTDMMLFYVKRETYNELCNRVCKEGYSSLLTVKYDGNQSRGNIEIKVNYGDVINEELEFNIIRMIYETYCELKSNKESE